MVEWSGQPRLRETGRPVGAGPALSFIVQPGGILVFYLFLRHHHHHSLSLGLSVSLSSRQCLSVVRYSVCVCVVAVHAPSARNTCEVTNNTNTKAHTPPTNQPTTSVVGRLPACRIARSTTYNIQHESADLFFFLSFFPPPSHPLHVLHHRSPPRASPCVRRVESYP